MGEALKLDYEQKEEEELWGTWMKKIHITLERLLVEIWMLKILPLKTQVEVRSMVEKACIIWENSISS